MKVLASRPLPGPAWSELAEVEYLEGPLSEGLRQPRPGVEALAVVGEAVDARTLDLLPDLRLVANYGAGYEGIDLAECRRRGVAVTNTPGVLDSAVADLTLAMILALRRRVVAADRFVRAGGWAHHWAELGALAARQLVGDDVGGATLGIVGLGNIGRAVARRARAFDMRLLYTRRRRASDAEERDLAVEYRELDDLLAEVDVVTLHVPLTAETRGLLDAARLARLRDGACVINTARGAVVDEAALVAELVSGRLNAALDVFANEPDVPAALLDLPNVVLTPHIGSATTGTRAAMTRLVVENIQAADAGRPLVTPV